MSRDNDQRPTDSEMKSVSRSVCAVLVLLAACVWIYLWGAT